MLSFSTTTRPLPGTTRRTLPRLPRSLPATTTTVSPFRTCAMAMAVSSIPVPCRVEWRARRGPREAAARGVRGCTLRVAADRERSMAKSIGPASNDLRSERDDLGELPVAQLAGHGAEDARAHGVVVGLEQDHGVAVEADIGAVLAADFLDRAHDDGAGDLALLHRPVRHRLLDGDDHNIAERGVALVGAAHDADALRLLGARVVRDVEHASGLDHGARSPLLTRPGSGLDGCATASPWTSAAFPR